MSSKSSTPSLGSRLYSYRYGLGLYLVIALAAYFRLYHLGTLPPGLSDAESVTATTALAIINKTQTLAQLLQPGLSHAVYSFVVAISIKLFGTTSFALRLPSALLGLGAVLATYVWIKSWFDDKTALVGALLVAVTPWTVGLSRIAVATTGTVLLVPITLWLLTKAIRSKKLTWAIVAGLALAFYSTSIAGLWFIGGLAVTIFPFRLLADRTIRRTILIMSGAAIVIGLPLVVLRFHHTQAHLPSVNPSTIGTAISRASLTLGMFNIQGDTDFAYNISGTPELNLFVGLMFLVGIVACLIHLHRARYRSLLVLTGALLIPVMAQPSAPNSLTALVAAPVILCLAAVGTIYMLQVWYSTFPINSAARTLGTVPIVLLLAISSYQGYKQYFVAWAHSPEVYTAYNENATALASFLNRVHFTGQRYIIAQGHDIDTINFLTSHKYPQVLPNQILTLPQAAQPQQIIFVTPQPTDIIPALKQRFPKAQLSQHFSEFNDNNQLFAVYQTKP